MCGKRAFASRAEANEHARVIAKAPLTHYGPKGGGSRGTRPYLCEDCGSWHLTSQTT